MWFNAAGGRRSAALRWRLRLACEQAGKASLALAACCLALLIYWVFFLRPAVALAESKLDEVRLALNVPLPPNLHGEKTSPETLTAAEYEQVKTLFLLLEKHGLEAKESRYQTAADTGSALTLEIPLQGTYPRLREALAEISTVLAVSIDSLTLSRPAPENARLAIVLRLTLAGEQP
jgi:hypothetical protein